MTDSSTELSNLIARYAELIDAGDLAGVADLLADAAVGAGDSDSLLTGRDAIHVAVHRHHPRSIPTGRRAPSTSPPTSSSTSTTGPAPPRPARTGPSSRPCPAFPSSPSWPAATTTASSAGTAPGGSSSAGTWSTWSAT